MESSPALQGFDWPAIFFTTLNRFCQLTKNQHRMRSRFIFTTSQGIGPKNRMRETVRTTEATAVAKSDVPKLRTGF
jgi:hypothetical protein